MDDGGRPVNVCQRSHADPVVVGVPAMEQVGSEVTAESREKMIAYTSRPSVSQTRMDLPFTQFVVAHTGNA
jgi:hypothetical protein